MKNAYGVKEIIEKDIGVEKYIHKEYVLSGPLIQNEDEFGNSNNFNYYDKDDGIIRFSSIPIERNKETNHFFIIGSPGSGKTQFLLPFIDQVRERLDKAFIFDIKGDFTETLPDIEGNEMILLAPWDKRGYAWRIGEDIFNAQLAREFAQNIIPDAEEIIYSTSARMILAGVIQYLQKTRGMDWDVMDIVKIATKDREELSNLIMDLAPEAAAIIKIESKLSQNIMTNLYAAMSMLIDLGRAWEKIDKSFSINELINREEPFTFIMQGSGIYKNMAMSLIASVLSSAAKEVEMLKDDKDRRIWFFLDEFPQLGKMEGFVPLLEIGRSKGASVVLAVQNINQIIDIYGEDLANSIQSMCGTQIYCRLSLGESANKISQMLGEREVLYTIPHANDLNFLQSISYHKEMKKVVEPYYLSNILGPKEDFIKILLVGVSNDYIELNLSYQNTEKYREKIIYQDWAKRTYKKNTKNN